MCVHKLFSLFRNLIRSCQHQGQSADLFFRDIAAFCSSHAAPIRWKISVRALMNAVAALSLVMLTACATLQKIVYRPDINQGNWLSSGDAARIHKGMTQQQVAYTLGTPMMEDPFGSSTWFYIFRQQSGRESATQQTLILTFDKNATLVDIKNE
jgi:outer membrane protein assembly factor BamE